VPDMVAMPGVDAAFVGRHAHVSAPVIRGDHVSAT
jgi:hypothetical protein